MSKYRIEGNILVYDEINRLPIRSTRRVDDMTCIELECGEVLWIDSAGNLIE